MLYMENCEYGKSFFLCQSIISMFSKRSRFLWFEKWKYYLNIFKYEQSILNLNICLKLRPNNAITLGTKEYAFMMLGQIREGHQCLNEAIQLNPKIAELYVDIGISFEGMRKIYLAMLSNDQASKSNMIIQFQYQDYINLIFLNKQYKIALALKLDNKNQQNQINFKLQ
ncbi:unnamed protein product [Paramecium pentaurelia]|uniref:Tetratricopeptide repeat protein n=1 Tax=Paramecium pentaurelia TaxID=43138 RepID=A0A8S1WWG8_9CILI|nr:unnamed protein product [Paramecium pentaurelia]